MSKSKRNEGRMADQDLQIAMRKSRNRKKEELARRKQVGRFAVSGKKDVKA